jgi:hypothetical protein
VDSEKLVIEVAVVRPFMPEHPAIIQGIPAKTANIPMRTKVFGLLALSLFRIFAFAKYFDDIRDMILFIPELEPGFCLSNICNFYRKKRCFKRAATSHRQG